MVRDYLALRTPLATSTLPPVSYQRGDVVTRREVYRGTPHLIDPVRVVEDAGDRLTVFLASGTPLSSPVGSWPWSEEGHPWAGRGRWEGHGVLQILSAVEPFSTWVFWDGEKRDLDAWYINLQEPFMRTPEGIDSQDLELDFVVAPDGSWHKKDDDLLDVWIEKADGPSTRLLVSGRSERGWRRSYAPGSIGGIRAGHRGSPRHAGSHGPAIPTESDGRDRPRYAGHVLGRECATDTRLDGDEVAADADDGEAGHFSRTFITLSIRAPRTKDLHECRDLESAQRRGGTP